MILSDFRKSIEILINNSNLSIDCIYFVMKDILNEVTDIYNSIRAEEERELQKKLEKVENEYTEELKKQGVSINKDKED